jgi:hypothetical protein
MNIDEESKFDYIKIVWAIAVLQVDTTKSNSYRCNISDLDVEVISRTTFGDRIQTNIIIYHDDYTVKYKRCWPGKSMDDNFIDTVSLEGDEDIFSQHLVTLKLS